MSNDMQDYSKNIPIATRNNGHFRNNAGSFASPLLPIPKQYERNDFSNNYLNQTNNNGIHSRLGRKSFNNFDSNSSQNHNRSDNNFNRKRASSGNEGPITLKRKWRSRQPFYPPASSSNQTNFAQNRLNTIRNTQTRNFQMEPKREPTESANDSRSEDFDATDITVEVINHNAQSSEESQYPIKFKMTLDPKAQADIKALQQKRKDKQVIFPFPVTPNTTGISLHERFTLL